MTTPNGEAAPPVTVVAERTRLRVPSRPDAVTPAADYLVRKALASGAISEGQTARALLALHEALTNAVVHGNLEVSSELKERDDDSFDRTLRERAGDARLAARAVDVQVSFDGRRCQWVVTDEGPGFDVDAVLTRYFSDPEQLLLASGRGIQIMRALMDEVRFEDGGRRVVLRLDTAPSLAA